MSTTLDPLAILADRIDPRPDLMASDPDGWARHRLGAYLWDKQREILRSIRDHKRTAVTSAHDLGKSYDGAVATCWWIDTHPVGEAFVASTAPTYQQVHSILWEETRKLHAKSAARARQGLSDRAMLGKVGLSDVWQIGEVQVGYGRKPADTDEHGFQGIHRRWVLAVIDEACGVPAQLWTAVEAITTNQDCRILAIGNPDDPNTEFGRVCRPGSGWNVIHLDGLASPNFTAEAVARFPEVAELMAAEGIEPNTEGVPEWLRPLLLDPEWVADKIRRWGADSPIFRSKVRGMFSEDAASSVVPASWVSRCRIGRDYHDRHLETVGQGVEFGIDIGAGGDETVIAAKAGPLAKIILRDRNPDTMRTVGLIIDAVRQWKPWRIKIDRIGIGQGVVDRLTEQQAAGHVDLEGISIVGVNVGERSDHPDRFVNKRSEIWWEVGRVLSEEGGWDLSEMDDDFAAAISSPTYTFDSAGRIKVESKAETRAKISRSPDDVDAVHLAFYSPSTGDSASLSTLPPTRETVVRRGDLTLRGRRYVDKE